MDPQHHLQRNRRTAFFPDAGGSLRCSRTCSSPRSSSRPRSAREGGCGDATIYGAHCSSDCWRWCSSLPARSRPWRNCSTKGTQWPCWRPSDAARPPWPAFLQDAEPGATIRQRGHRPGGTEQGCADRKLLPSQPAGAGAEQLAAHQAQAQASLHPPGPYPASRPLVADRAVAGGGDGQRGRDPAASDPVGAGVVTTKCSCARWNDPPPGPSSCWRECFRRGWGPEQLSSRFLSRHQLVVTVNDAKHWLGFGCRLTASDGRQPWNDSLGRHSMFYRLFAGPRSSVT